MVIWQRIFLPTKKTQELWVPSLGQEDLLERETATHSSILAWKVPWTEEPGGLQSMGSQKSQTRLKQLNNNNRSLNTDPSVSNDYQSLKCYIYSILCFNFFWTCSCQVQSKCSWSVGSSASSRPSPVSTIVNHCFQGCMSICTQWQKGKNMQNWLFTASF